MHVVSIGYDELETVIRRGDLICFTATPEEASAFMDAFGNSDLVKATQDLHDKIRLGTDKGEVGFLVIRVVPSE